MSPRVTQVTTNPDHTLILTFDNGETRRFDLRPYLDYTVFQPLRDVAFFLLARPAHGTVVWPGGIDFAPETLFIDGEPVETRNAA